MVALDERALKDSAGWNHICQVVGQVAAERPAGVLDSLEAYSQGAQAGGKAIPPAVTTIYMDARPKAKHDVDGSVAQEVDWSHKFALQVLPPKPAKTAEEEEEAADEAAEEDHGELPDIVYEQSLLRNFGEGVSDVEAYRITVALKRLLDKEPLAKARFWGKIVGTKRDYYVAETKVDEGRVPEKEEPEEDGAELVGKAPETIFQGLNTYKAKEPVRVLAEEAKGTNEFKYYVTTSDDLTTWVELPDVLPSQIIAARLIARLFTGHLEAPVQCHPPFPGVERHYLRAQIARITHTTAVCPKDIYAPEPVEEEEEEDEEEGAPKKVKRFEVPATEEVPPLNPTEQPDASDAEAVAPVKAWFNGYCHDELLEPKCWVHTQPQLLGEGRATVFKPEDAEQAEDELEDEPPAAPVEFINPFLSDLSHDAELTFAAHSKDKIAAWCVRKAYASASSRSKSYLVRSVLWPGAMAVAAADDHKPGAYFLNIYVGQGVKNTLGKAYCPALPPLPSLEMPTGMLRLQKDCTRDDELEFEPEPIAPVVPGAENDEDGDEE
jgi:hypothetical protein